jgi:hypothetical protein
MVARLAQFASWGKHVLIEFEYDILRRPAPNGLMPSTNEPAGIEHNGRK